MIKSLIAASMIVFSSSAFMANAASTGTITFNGLVTATTCDVSVDGQGADAVVGLPTVSTDQLVNAGDVTGRKNFNIVATNCTLSTATGDIVSQVSTFFQAGATVDPTTGRLKQQDAAGATNVELQLLDGGTYQPIKAGDTSQITGNTYYDLTDDGTTSGNLLPTITMPYAVEYFATGQSTPGVVTSSVVYNLMYK